MKTGLAGLAAAAALCLGGCSRAVVEGKVVDVRGEALPGVAVRIEDTDFMGLSNALGEYRIRYRPGSFLLKLNKTGYTPGEIAFDIPEARRVEASTAELWPVPSTQGVYLFENYRYRETTRVEPREFFLAEGDLAYGTEQRPRVSTSDATPLLISYRLPRYDARLSRLRQSDAKRAAGQKEIITVWIDAGTIRPKQSPIDAAKGLLQSLQLPAPLEPGMYAVHWGALEGYTALERRIFLFQVAAELTPERALQLIFFLASIS